MSNLLASVEYSTLVAEIKSSAPFAQINSSFYSATVRSANPVKAQITSTPLFRGDLAIRCEAMGDLIVSVDVLPEPILGRFFGVGTRVQIAGDPIDEGKSGVITHISNPWAWLGDPQPVYTIRFPDGSGRGFVRSSLICGDRISLPSEQED